MPGMYDVETVTVKRAGSIVDAGNVYPDPAGPQPVSTSSGWAVQAGDMREEHDRADGHIAEYTLWGPLDVDVREDDELEFTHAGETLTGYKVDGRPRRNPDPTGFDPHQQVAVVKREG